LDFHVSDSIAPSTEILEQISIPNDDQRAQTFVAFFQGPDIAPRKTITSFTKFSPITNEELPILLPNAPFGDKPMFYFESIPNTENEWFYQFIGNYINRGASVPQPFEVDIQVLSGDNTTLQTWSYNDCSIIDYISFLDDSLITRKFTKLFETEIHDRAIFECNGFFLDGTQKSPENPPTKTLDYVDFLPSEEKRVQRIVITASGGEFEEPQSTYTITKFEPISEERSSYTPASHQLDSIGFSLESLPSKEKVGFYKFLSRYVNLEKDPEPFDMTIDLVTGDGSIVQSWQYTKCDVTVADNYLQDVLLFYTMNGKSGSELREKSVFECIGFSVNFDTQTKVLQDLPDSIPSYEDRGIFYLFTVSDGDFTTPKTTALVSKFSSKDSFRDLENQISTYGSLRQSITNQGTISSFDQSFTRAQFYGESLPNKFHSGQYEFVERYINGGNTPELFDVRVDTVTGDGTILYSADYKKCEVQSYATYLNDNEEIVP